MILFSASYSRGTPSARLRVYDVCTELCRRGIDADITGPDDGIDCGRQRFASLGRDDVLYMQKWASNLHRVHQLDRCIAKVVYDFDDLTSAREHRMLVERCDAFVVGAKTLAQQVKSKPVLTAPTPLHPALFGDHVPYRERISRDRPGVVVAKYGFKPYLGKLRELAPELRRALDRHGYSLWFLGAHHASEYKALKEMYPTCSIHPLVKMDEFYEVQVPIIKQAAWGFVPYDKRCKGKSATSVLTLMACGVPCFAEGTLVLTKDGYRPIGSVSVGDEVLTHRGRWRRVTGAMSRNASLRMVQAQGVPNIITTDEHPFYARLKKRAWNNDPNSSKRGFADPAWTQASELSENHFVAQTMPKVCRSDHDGSFWWLIGRYLADGWFVDYQSGGRRFRRTIICCPKEETDFLLQRIKNAGFHSTHVDESTVSKFHIYNRELFDFLQPFGRHAHGKLVPGHVFGLSRPKTRALLEGYFSGDGCVSKNANGNGTHLRATAVSKALVLSVALLAQRAFGVVAGIKRYQAKPGKKKITQREQFEIVVPRRNNVAFVDENDYGWKRVVRSKPCGTGKVWNISVDEDESYMADGAIVHNCQAFAFGECGEMFGRRLRRWAVNTDERFFENAERLMSDPAQAERFIEIAAGRVREYSLDAHCDRLIGFLRNLGVAL